MIRVTLRLYAELNERLPAGSRQRELRCELADDATIRTLLALYTIDRIDLALVNGASAGLDQLLRDGDRVSIYPVFDSIEVGPVTKICDRPQRRSRFVLDVHLGKLAHHLRMLGFDTLYRKDWVPATLLAMAREEDRILLSKSVALVCNEGLLASFRIVSSDPREQLLEVLRRFDLLALARPYTRCLHCNLPVVPVLKSDVIDRLPAKSRDAYEDFTLCPKCQRVYWQGVHTKRINQFLQEIAATLRGGIPKNGKPDF